MPRMQVYLPDDLYKAVKEQGLPASELLQQAVRQALHRRELEAEADRYIAELEAEVGEPTEADRRWAQEILDGLGIADNRHAS